MRRKTNMSGLVSHTNPNGKSYTSSENKCREGLKRLQKLVDRGYEIAGITKNKPEVTPREVIVKVFDGKVKMTYSDYQQVGQGFTVLVEIF